MNTDLMRGYAKSILINGVALQKGQLLAIRTDVKAAFFARIVAEEAFKLGAFDVDVMYEDETFDRIRIEMATNETLSDAPEWKTRRRLRLAEKGGCILTIRTPDPEAFAGLDADKVMLNNKTVSLMHKEFSKMTQTYQVRWCVVAVPGDAWANMVFPELPTEEAVEALWKAVLHTTHADEENPVEAWQEHMSHLEHYRETLTALDLASLTFKNSHGTNFTAELCDEASFVGGNCISADGIAFCPNMPTEEVFMVPNRMKINGVVRNSMPLVYSGNIIDGFELTFRDGKVVDAHAETGEEILKNLLAVDEGASYIGECSLVPSTSTIKETGRLFYNTLFDENAACHLALGNGYPSGVGGDDRSEEALKAKGMNTSIIHVDFMFGTDDIECIGITRRGEQVTILKDGKFVI